jgi:hypothetical protein
MIWVIEGETGLANGGIVMRVVLARRKATHYVFTKDDLTIVPEVM